MFSPAGQDSFSFCIIIFLFFDKTVNIVWHEPRVSHVCFDHRTATNRAGQKTISVTKNDISDKKGYRLRYRFLCHCVIALIKAQVCDMYEMLLICRLTQQKIAWKY